MSTGSKMSKYLEIFKVTIGETIVYRLNIFLWRIRNLLNLFIIYFLWNSIFEKNQVLFSYTRSQMLTYILLSSLISSFVFASRTVDIAGQIIQGDIINIILKPINFFKYHLTRDLSDKLLTICFTTIEISIIIFFFKPGIYIQQNIFNLLIFLLFVIFGVLISFFISISLSFIGFWTPETWSPRFIYFILIFFLSGTYFPLDILPKPIYYILLATPFPYLYYLPTKIYLSGATPDLFFAMIICVVWIFLTYNLSRFLWDKGLKSYNFFGR